VQRIANMNIEDNINEIREGMADFEVRISLLEGLHASTNTHLLNNENNVMVEIYRENSKDDIEYLENILKWQDRIMKDIVILQKAIHGLQIYVQSLSGKVTLLEERNTRVLKDNRIKYK
jgi:hypothetical protein